MKFLFVANFSPEPDSGSAGSLIAIGNALVVRGHRVDFEWRDESPRRLPHRTLSTLFELPRRQFRQVVRRLEATDYDVVIASQPYAYLVYERLPRRFPTTLFLNRTHGWEDRVYHAYRQLRWDSPRSTGRRVASRLAERMVHRTCVRTARTCHGLIAPSSRCAQFIRTAYSRPASNVAVIPYGVDEAIRSGDQATHPTGGDLGILFVGNYLPLKGASILEASLPRIAHTHPKVRVTLVVDAGNVDRVRQYYQPLFGDRLTVSPWVPRPELRRIYAQHDVLVHPSLFEGFGKTWQEAMACGLCVVGFGEGGLPDVATHGVDALFCEPGNRASFQALLDSALADPSAVRAMGDRARELIREYTWDRNAEATERFCEELRRDLV